MPAEVLSSGIRRPWFLWLAICLLLAASGAANYYDQNDMAEGEEPIFVDDGSSSIVRQLTKDEEVAQIPPVGSEPLDITADTRFPDGELSWQLKFSGDGGPVPNKKGSNTKIKRRTQMSQKESVSFYPPENARKLIGATLKRANVDVATTYEELQEKIELEKERQAKDKRNSHSHWACNITYIWQDLGSDHYPRNIKNGQCSSNFCSNGHSCVPKKMKIKILKRFSLSDSVSAEPNNASNQIPVELRSNWQFYTVEITHCCECGGSRAHVRRSSKK